LCATKKAFDKAWFSTDSFDRIPEFAPEMGQIEATHMASLDPFEVGPQPLTRMQLRSIGRELLQVDPVGCAVRQKGL
jgi:hypothetical protein